jgi:hypothetical protein
VILPIAPFGPALVSAKKKKEEEANPNLKPTWLAIMTSRARPDEPEVSRWRAGGENS